MKKLRNNKIRKLLAFMVALALMVSCMPSAYTISASEAFGDGTEDIFTDGEITSEPAAEESTPDVSSADQEETEQAQQSTLTYENDSVKVTAEALEDGALPQNTALKADGVNENSSVSYDTVSQKLSAAATDKDSSLRGFFAYDVYFADGDGNRVEPNGRVRVTFEYKTPAAPELTDAASTSVTVEKLHYNSSTGDTDVNTLQANEDLKVLNVNEGKQIQTLQVETGNAAVFAVMWDSPETADVEAEAVSGNEDEVSIASEELTDGMDISDEPEQDAAETPAAENPEVTPDAEPSEAPAENPDAEPTEAPAEDPDVVEEPAEDIESPDEVTAADENGETSLIEVLGDDTNLRVSPSIEAEVLATVNAGTQLTLLDTVTAEDGATWYKVSWEGTEAYIRSDMAQVVDSNDEAEEPEDVQEEEIQPEITRYDYKSDEVNVKVTLTDPADLPDNAELSVTPVELSQEAEDQITEEAIKEKKAIEKIHSYDIKFLVDGEEVQPGASVKVSVSLNDEKKIKDADVYHVDENDNVENMDGSVAKNGDVEFETTHFSTYVIVQKGGNAVEVTIRHLNAADGKAIYSEDKRTILVGGKINDYTKAQNWEVSKVKVNGAEVNKDKKIEVAQNSTIEVYYTPKHNANFQGPTSFYDYTVKAGESYDRNTGKQTYYSFNMLGDAAKNGNQKITAGTQGHNYDSYKYGFTVDSGYKEDGGKITATVNGYNKDVRRTEGLLKEVENDGKGAVKFKYPEPGFFVDQDATVNINSTKTYLRKVIKDYKLVFDQKGDSYKLTKVINKNGEQLAAAGNDFFPLDKVSRSEKSDNNHNYFFGMRYDVTFKIGDYVGPLNYTFTGDDDLWVVLDGKQIVIDLGGIHDAATKTVDLWDYVKGEDGEIIDKEKEHTLTILYMERGAYLSNCQMDFTLPSARISEVTNVPTTDLVLKKVNKKQEALSGARFTLVNSETNESQIATSVDETGLVNFTRLRPGTYTLTEDIAPEGYEASNESWIVKVTLSEDNKAVATLYKADGKTKIEKNTDSLYHIMNYTQEEIIKASMDYSKTATVNDWDKRTYDINITAASTSTSTITTTEKAVADIMLVLDVSGSMDETTVSYSYVAENTTDGRAGLNTGTLYYVKKDESYVKLQYYNNYYGRTGWYIGDDRWSQTKADDSTYNGCKIYLKKTEKKLTALQNAVKQFITDTANKSPDSKIGITAFSSAGYGSHGKTEDLQKAGDNKENLTRFVDSLVANGGTDPYVGLKNAKSKLDAATMSGDTKPKYVLLFTDGEPTGSGNSWDTTAQQNAENITNGTESIKGIKQEGYTVYTIGFGLRDKAKAFLEGGTYGRTTYPGIASKNCAFNAENATQLGDIFKDIQDTITQDISITGATITDIIEPSFELLKDDGTLYTQDDLNDGVKVNDGTVSLVNGNYQIQWTDQTIPNKKNGEWNKTIKVKAKDNFVGGNNVTTNISPGSKISTGYGDVELPQPTVNVKVNLVVKDKDVWIYKGDTVPTDETILNQLFNESETSYSKGTISAADAKDHITLQWKDGTQTNISKENMATTPDDDTEYYLEVTYDPKTTSTDESKTNTTTSDGEQHVVGAAEKAYNPDNSNNPYGIYKIHVIKGQIQITKNVTETSDTDRTFTFNVNAKNGQNVSDSQVSVTVKANETSGTVTLSDLSRGEYTVTEDNADGYFIQAFDIVTGDGQTDCENVKSDADKSLKFTLGNDVKKANVITTDYTYTSGGVKGVASYTNEAVISLDLKKTDTDNHSLTGAKFKLEMKDGDIWKSLENDMEVKNGTSEIELNNLKSGIYKLTETTAPKGYSLLGSSICFKVATGSVTLVDENGDPAQKSNMWSLENKVLTIKNAKLYSLPESGGPGTYGFTISGVAILATALLLFINNKRREEEAKRS
ncbi:fibro-slime domain-containing protein [Ruminococcus sp. AM36-2AA]|nr:fibro-slime domain-containing protein [Ruminococcus sp. AM36-5]RGH54314.1 fibro-slime domain-containing protein [Ruminococcus sp. AM36-2AA]